jgi:hypothetical protein
MQSALTQAYVLNYSQSSLRDCSRCQLLPGLRSELLSAVPSGLFMLSALTQAYVLNYSQSSLRDWLMLLTPPGE